MTGGGGRAGWTGAGGVAGQAKGNRIHARPVPGHSEGLLRRKTFLTPSRNAALNLKLDRSGAVAGAGGWV